VLVDAGGAEMGVLQVLTVCLHRGFIQYRIALGSVPFQKQCKGRGIGAAAVFTVKGIGH
jgi:hypothetical protein